MQNMSQGLVVVCLRVSLPMCVCSLDFPSLDSTEEERVGRGDGRHARRQARLLLRVYKFVTDRLVSRSSDWWRESKVPL